MDAVPNAIRCAIIALIPPVLPLNITLESPLKAFQSAQISLHWAPDDPVKFVIGAFTNDTPTIAATMIEGVENFTADRVVNMTFNYTSTSGKNCILYAWVPQAAEPRSGFAHSEPFSVTGGSTPHSAAVSIGGGSFTAFVLTTSIPAASNPTTSSPAASNPTTSSPTSSSLSIAPSFTSSPVPGNTQSTTKAVPTEAVVGAVIGAFALFSIVSAALFLRLRRRRNRKLESAPSRAFWRYLDRKGPSISHPVRETLPPYTAQGRTFQRPAVRPPPLNLPD
ncbi:hypothetical protein IW261DRAFT_1568406 [Armillaria novae-zelandiae]|uniref:Uncharacterized protein n=1 Tax=Armillaria novae-zelandiae TaxID=153914 RepID=A0AA39U5T2_9AGAR|nr:hypothetical protein IW261DRAFT_1568406 [Armillaria novae-zelandiae]